MTEEIVIDGELSCNNCLEKTRCKQQQEVKVKRMDAILSYITNKDNEKYIAELKNEIPAITRCDVVLEKQLKRLEKENKRLKERQINWYNTEAQNYRSALEEIREVLKFYADTWVDEKIYPNLRFDNTKAKEGLSRINEVLQ